MVRFSRQVCIPSAAGHVPPAGAPIPQEDHDEPPCPRVPAALSGYRRDPYGYLNVGVVEQGPAELAGRAVFCLYPHQTHYVVPATAVTRVPEGVPARRAVLAGTVETAVNALWDAAPLVGDRIAVVGGGMVGCSVAALPARFPGVRVQLVDTDPARAGAAAALGVDFCTATGG
ncbi:hypothetical protein GCM10010129_79150 [Streptomyces fumigatiscleroticus]|nr:hypothetical protein GCM10010129_79150 [Streptomyces fumigatiscleroticus]